ncbi:hypothetical protein POM88_000741 [Heracleum sosnowskyi]|uniref:Uncharacterized protein n=1 Tax=Heracleum sosnowskyi TaxID=360622 RepID=A0AAD8JCE9_9APIA|nr:hypothetical protein POM88_000741 [Heracleum sosnowskyi]
MASLRLQALLIFNLVLLLQFGTHQRTLGMEDDGNPTGTSTLGMGDDGSTTSIAKLRSSEKFGLCVPYFLCQPLRFLPCWCCFHSSSIDCYATFAACRDLC